ncbi:hypothetical protein HPP92_000735 [Vanilla planifolia]|uniref:Uncharacterized protein n=1 Tax=Vanilla planifolia TaxID=51239 RepID=A0A835VKX4_VANPL|nr:hypothetical protein HPP92_000735 [Vanilla planifolia]
MSKKKFATGSTTMTLKDFHGGSIPSELPLPSAPGIPIGQAPGVHLRLLLEFPPRHVWTTNGLVPALRVGIHVSSTSAGRLFFLPHRSSVATLTRMSASPSMLPPRPGAPPSLRRKLPNPPPVVAAPGASVRSDVKKPVSSSVVAHHLSPSPGVSTSSAGNAWAIKKELPVSGAANCELPRVLPPENLSEVAVASRFAQASAIEKISSGRWQSKPPDVEVIRFQDVKIWDLEPGMRLRIGNDEDCHDERAFTILV